MMQIWAAIDLMGGSAVTLVQGRESEKSRWNQGPVRLADRWQREGADGLHLIDLDAAFQKGSNERIITEIIANARIPIQLGGGIRSEEIARQWLESGVERAIVGTMAYAQPAVLAKLLRDYGPERIVVAADYKDGEVVTKGWKEGRGMSVQEAAGRFERAGVVNLLVTCVGRDGMGSGPDLETIRGLATSRESLEIIASGGIRNERDLTLLEDAGAAGAVIGRALYEGTLKLPNAKNGGPS